MANNLFLRQIGKYLAKSHNKSIPSSRVFSSVSPKTLNEFQTNQTELKNGIRVASEDLGGATATVGLWLESGSRYETERTSGVANLVLHSLLRSRPQLESEVQAMGGVVSGGVSRDRSHLSIRCLSSDIPKAIEIIGKLISSPNLNETLVKEAKGVIARELRESDTNYESVVMNMVHATAYQSTSLALPAEGSSAALQSLTADDVHNYVNTHLKGPRMVVSVAGSVDHNHIVRAVEQHLGSVGIAYDKSEIPVLSRCRYTGSDIRIRDDAMSVAHVALAVEGPGYDSADHLALELATHLMGRWDRTFGGGADCSSYLGVCSASDHLTHSLRAFNVAYRESGLFGVYFVAERMKLEDAVCHLTDEWRRFCTQLADNELNRAKNSFLALLKAQNEGSNRVSRQVANQVLNYGRRLPLDELESRVLSLNASHVRRVCDEYIWDRCPVVAAIGPVEQLELYENLRGKFYWFRY